MFRRNFLKFLTLLAGASFLETACRAQSGGKEPPAEAAQEPRPLSQDLQKAGQGKRMKITVITGSPRKNGNTAYLAEQFIKGAKESGHEIFRFDSAFQKVSPCRACNACGMNGPCVLNDDFDKLLRPRLLDADAVIFVSPMYYFGFSAQLKTVIDRFYAFNGQLQAIPKKAALIMAYADTSERERQAMLAHYRTLLDYLNWRDVGQVIAPGFWTAGSVKGSSYCDQAYQLGKNLK